MGRRIRNVPPHWQHPEVDRAYGRIGPQPMFDETFAEAVVEWKAGFTKWESGNDPDREEYKRDDGSYLEYWEWNNPPPDRAYYRPWKDEEATWFQLWETVSEGTPVSPPFATKEELAAYLAEHGDFWDQKRCKEPDWASLWGGEPGKSGWGRERAERFVFGSGWSPSMAVIDGKVLTNPGDIEGAH